MPYPFTAPEFLRRQSADEIHRRMLDSMPGDIDKSELQIPYDLTRPAAMELAEFAEFRLAEAIKIMFAQWAGGKWLEMHAEREGIARRPASRAAGLLLAKGRPGARVPKGARFATAAGVTASVLFEASKGVAFDGGPGADGLAEAWIPVQAAEGGRGGNVPPDSITLMLKPDAAIAYLSNPEATTGGAPEETDDELRERVLYVTRHGMSWTGCDADYVRWAMEVPGVGHAATDAEWDGPGTVRLFVVDSNGAPANQRMLDEVYAHIMSPEDRMSRKAPIGASLTVSAPKPIYIDVAASVSLSEGEDIGTAEGRFREALDRYWLEAATESDARDVQSGLARNYVRYVRVGAALAGTPGVSDYAHGTLEVNGGTGNILIPPGEYPATREVRLVGI